MKLDQNVGCNDRKLEVWTLSRHVVGQHNPEHIKVQVYAVPKKNARGAETEYLKIVINGIIVKATDIIELRRKAQEVYSGLVEDEYEKVLIIEIGGHEANYSNRGAKGSEFGLDYRIGWRVNKLGVIFNQNKNYLITIDNEDPHNDPNDTYKIFGGGRENKTAVVPWTQEREDVLKGTVVKIGQMRREANKMVLDFDNFANLLDSKAGMNLLGTGEK